MMSIHSPRIDFLGKKRTIDQKNMLWINKEEDTYLRHKKQLRN